MWRKAVEKGQFFIASQDVLTVFYLPCLGVANARETDELVRVSPSM